MHYTLVYDSDCGPCSKFRDTIAILDTHDKIRYAGLGEADQMGLLQTVPATRRYRSFHLVSYDGSVWSGAEALPRLAALIPGGFGASLVLARNHLAFRCAAFVYGVFSRLHDSGSCS